ncbi:MAG: hypothetical protein V2A73_16255 [Pseudomonadota bacterium]
MTDSSLINPVWAIAQRGAAVASVGTLLRRLHERRDIEGTMPSPKNHQAARPDRLFTWQARVGFELPEGAHQHVS